MPAQKLAANGQEQIFDVGVDVNTPAARVKKSAVQSIPNITATVLTWDTEEFDTDSIHDNITNNTRMTCRTAGKYLVAVAIRHSANATGHRQNRLYKNGVLYDFSAVPSAGSTEATVWPLVSVMDLVVGDYLEAYAYQSSGGALDVETVFSIFSMIRIGPSVAVSGSVVPQGFKGCRVAQITTSQSIPNITSTAVIFNGETFDTDGYHDNVTNNSRFTAIRPGKHRLSGRIWWPDNAVGLRYITIYVNGVGSGIRVDEERRKPIAGDWNTFYFEGLFHLAAGDYMEVYVYQDSGGAIGLAQGTTVSPASGTNATFEELG